jgi:predicted nucleic-acid-binding protein
MRAADTNVVVRIVTRDTESQAIAADAFIERGAWVSLLVLAETAWVLRDLYEVEHEQIISAIDMLLQHKTLSIQDADVAAAALDQYRQRPKIGFSDCLVLEIARKAGYLPLGTFDRDLSKLDGAERL